MTAFFEAIAFVLNPFDWPLYLMIFGTVVSIFIGAVPGLTGGMLISLCIPLTFGMNATNALVMLVSMYVGSVSGGLVSATLLRMPGTPSSVMTTLDGFPMAQKGQPERALALAIGASVIGGLIAAVFLIFFTRPLSRLAIQFSPFEYFTMVLMAIVLIATLSQGSMIKGLISGVFGMALALPGFNDSDGQLRLTFGFRELDDGFKILPVLLGVFVMSQVIKEAFERRRIPFRLDVAGSRVLVPAKEWLGYKWNILRSGIIGTWIGILPGVGASISAMVAYAVTRNLSKTPEKFGTGEPDGIIASEAANNANVGGALIPLLAFGIPGSPIDAILLAAFIVHGIQPGPLLMLQNAPFAWAVIASYVLAVLLVFVVMTLSVRHMAKIIVFDRAFLMPLIVVACVVGAYATGNRFFDVWVVVIFGVLGFGLEYFKIPLGPFVIGFVLTPIFEEQLRASLQMGDDGLWDIFTRPYPIALSFVVISLVMLLWPIVGQWRNRNRKSGNTIQ